MSAILVPAKTRDASEKLVSKPAQQNRDKCRAGAGWGVDNPRENAPGIANDLLMLRATLSGSSSRSPLAARNEMKAVRGLSFRAGKRAFDVAFAAVALLLLAPVLCLCALAVWAESRSSILFRQNRLGRDGFRFRVLKFRTMIPDAEAKLQRLLEENPAARQEWDATGKLRLDPRVTRVGRFLRRTSLDELPQFWNVLVGEMSVVGPRPIVAAEIEVYQRAFRTYCAVRPGITGLWQVSGRSTTGYAERVALDCEYVGSWSFMRDLRILVKTVPVVLAGSGAY